MLALYNIIFLPKKIFFAKKNLSKKTRGGGGNFSIDALLFSLVSLPDLLSRKRILSVSPSELIRFDERKNLLST